MAVGGGKRVGEHNNKTKEGRAGRRAPKRKDGNGSEGGGGGDCGGKGDGGGICCSDVRCNDGNDDNNNDDNDNMGDGSSDGCSECDGNCSDDFGCRGNGYFLR